MKYKFQLSIIIFPLVFISTIGCLVAQNLVVNGDFEEISLDSHGNKVIKGWKFLDADPIEKGEIINNIRGENHQKEKDGSLASRIGKHTPFATTFIFKEGIYDAIYLAQELAQPLKQDRTYKVTYYVKTADMSGSDTYNIQAIDAFLSVDLVLPKKAAGGNRIYGVYPQIRNSKILTKKDGWLKVSGEFKAKGGEKYITIGTFPPFKYLKRQFSIPKEKRSKRPGTPIVPFGVCYYYVDDVSIIDVTKDNSGDTSIAHLAEVEVGTSITIENILYAFNSARLQPSSFVELDVLVEVLSKNPKLKIEVGGHTDNVGNEDYNKKLSNARAKSVVEYLTENGIDQSRLLSKGYGSGNPNFSNDDLKVRHKNRRVEIKVVGKS